MAWDWWARQVAPRLSPFLPAMWQSTRQSNCHPANSPPRSHLNADNDKKSNDEKCAPRMEDACPDVLPPGWPCHCRKQSPVLNEKCRPSKPSDASDDSRHSTGPDERDVKRESSSDDPWEDHSWLLESGGLGQVFQSQRPTQSSQSAKHRQPVVRPHPPADLSRPSSPSLQLVQLLQHAPSAQSSQPTKPLSRLENIPRDVFLEVLYHLDYPDLVALKGANKAMRDDAVETERLRKSKLEHITEAQFSEDYRAKARGHHDHFHPSPAKRINAKYGWMPCFRCYMLKPADKFALVHRRLPAFRKLKKSTWTPFCRQCGRKKRAKPRLPRKPAAPRKKKAHAA